MLNSEVRGAPLTLIWLWLTRTFHITSSLISLLGASGSGVFTNRKIHTGPIALKQANKAFFIRSASLSRMRKNFPWVGELEIFFEIFSRKRFIFSLMVQLTRKRAQLRTLQNLQTGNYLWSLCPLWVPKCSWDVQLFLRHPRSKSDNQSYSSQGNNQPDLNSVIGRKEW